MPQVCGCSIVRGTASLTLLTPCSHVLTIISNTFAGQSVVWGFLGYTCPYLESLRAKRIS